MELRETTHLGRLIGKDQRPEVANISLSLGDEWRLGHIQPGGGSPSEPEPMLLTAKLSIGICHRSGRVHGD